MAVIGSVRFVDEVGENYLSRGPHFLKDNDTKFDVASLKAAIKFERTWIPDRYYLVDINLVHAHEAALAAEIAFFNEHPSEGQLIWWDTNGTDVCCFDVTDPNKFAQMVATLDEWISDEPISRVDTLRSWLETPKLPKRSPTGVPYVFYVHCDGGCDRTGVGCAIWGGHGCVCGMSSLAIIPKVIPAPWVATIIARCSGTLSG